ncbi:hypothetical protein JXA47_07440 [Candidatus Sumerlaeota bacterium]|nr:hypothetical protein [Candidatus Sumerlaeota bacterium]
MFETDNPLLGRFWRRQFRLRWLHRSSVLWVGLLLAILLVVIQWDFARGQHPGLWWFIAMSLSLTFVSPASTLIAMSQMSRGFHRLRTDRHLEDLLVTRLTGRDLTLGLVVPVILGQWILWVGLSLILVGLYFEIPKHSPHVRAEPEQIAFLLLMGLYGPVQSLYSAVITLRLSMAIPRLFAVQLAAVGVLVVLPVALLCACIFSLMMGATGMNEGEFVVFVFLLICLKFAIAAGLSAAIRDDFQGRCRLTGE